MAQTKLKVKKTQGAKPKPVKTSKVGMNHRRKTGKSAVELAKQKISRKLEIGINQKIEKEMAHRVTKNNGKLTVVKLPTQDDKNKKVKKNHH
eukprot:gene17493-20871_t